MNKIGKIFLTVLLILLILIMIYFAIERNNFEYYDYPSENQIYASEFEKEPN